jgi:WD40 repeat protein
VKTFTRKRSTWVGRYLGSERRSCSSAYTEHVIEPPLAWQGHVDADVGELAFDASGRRLASGTFDGTICEWDVGTGACTRRIVAHEDPITAVAFQDNGDQLVSAAIRGPARIWSTSDGLVGELEVPGGAWCGFIADRPIVLGNGGEIVGCPNDLQVGWIAVGHLHGTSLLGGGERVSVIDTTSWSLVRSWELSGTCAISATETSVMAGTVGGTVVGFPLANNAEPTWFRVGTPAWAVDAEVKGVWTLGERIVVVSEAGVGFIEIASRQELVSGWSPCFEDDRITHGSLARHNDVLALGNSCGFGLWSLRARRWLWSSECGEIMSLQFSPSGDRIAAGTSEGRLLVYAC